MSKPREKVFCELLVKTEYLVTITRVCPLVADRAIIKKQLSKFYEVSLDEIEDDFDNYLTAYFSEREGDYITELYKQAIKRNNPNIGDEAEFINETLSNELMGLNNLTVKPNEGWTDSINLADVLVHAQLAA